MNRTSIVIASIFLCAVVAFSQSDAERFAEGRTALDKYNDCYKAISALVGVSDGGRHDPTWIAYMARAEECVGFLRSSLTMWEMYKQSFPSDADVINKIGDLRYRVSKAKDNASPDALFSWLRSTGEPWRSTRSASSFNNAIQQDEIELNENITRAGDGLSALHTHSVHELFGTTFLPGSTNCSMGLKSTRLDQGANPDLFHSEEETWDNIDLSGIDANTISTNPGLTSGFRSNHYALILFSAVPGVTFRVNRRKRDSPNQITPLTTADSRTVSIVVAGENDAVRGAELLKTLAQSCRALI